MLKNGKVFLGLAFTLRIFEACGNSMFLTGSFSAIAREFPDKVASMFAMIELFFGIGLCTFSAKIFHLKIFQVKLSDPWLVELSMRSEDLLFHSQ